MSLDLDEETTKRGERVWNHRSVCVLDSKEYHGRGWRRLLEFMHGSLCGWRDG